MIKKHQSKYNETEHLNVIDKLHIQMLHMVIVIHNSKFQLKFTMKCSLKLGTTPKYL